GSIFSEIAPGGSTMAGRCASKAYSIVHEGAGSPLRLMSMYTVKTGSSEKTPKSLSPPPLGPAATTVRPYEPVASGPKGRPAPGVAALLAPPTIDIPANGPAPGPAPAPAPAPFPVPAPAPGLLELPSPEPAPVPAPLPGPKPLCPRPVPDSTLTPVPLPASPTEPAPLASPLPSSARPGPAVPGGREEIAASPVVASASAAAVCCC